MHNQRLTFRPLQEGDQIVLLQLEAPMREKTSNNLWIVSLAETFQKKTLQMRCTSSDSTPTEQEIRDCFAPLYSIGTATDATTSTPGGSTADTGYETYDDEVGSSSESVPSNNY